MAEASRESGESRIKSDEAWKERVKAEDAKLDAQRGQDTEQQADQRGESDPSQLPKPTISTLVGMFSTQAMVALGLIGDPEGGKSEVHLPLARHFIDLLGVVEEKTSGNLSDEEARLLDQTLHELRMIYVEKSRGQ